MEKKTLPVLGMACAGCSANVERKLRSLQGVESVAVSLPGRSAVVEYDEKTISEFVDAWSDNETAILRLLQNAALWGEDLSQLPNVADTVQEMATKIDQKGVRAVLQEMKGTMVHA